MSEKPLSTQKKKRVLIAEDDKLLAKLLTDMLESRGYEVKIVPDGARALLEFMQFEPDIVLLDFVMPHFDGLVVAEQLRRKRTDVPMVMMTGKSNPELKHRAKAAGINHFLSKPFGLDDVIKVTSLCAIGAI